MNSTISRVAGLASVAVFVGLLTFIVYTQVQSEPEPVEQPFPEGAHPFPGATPRLEGFDPSQMLPTPLVEFPDVGLVDITLDAVVPSCVNGETHLNVTAAKPFPEGTWISVIPSRMTEKNDEGLVTARYSPIGDSLRVTVDEAGATEPGGTSSGKDTLEFSLPRSLTEVLTEPGYDVLLVTAWARGDGVRISSVTTLLELAEVACP